MCRLCGQVMYETGGQMNFLGYIALFMAFSLFVGILHLGMPNWWWWKILDPLLNFLLLGFVGYKIYQYFASKFR